MSNIKIFDTNNKKPEQENILLENYMRSFRNPQFDHELVTIKEESNSFIKENMIQIEYYYTIDKEEIENIARVKIIKDRKVAQIEFIKLETQQKDFIIKIAEDLIEMRDLKDIFVFINKDKKRTIKELIEKGFISLETGEEEYIPLLFEMERKYENGRHI
ncbi:MAG: hypothetical protein HFJ38_01310 [Bacilli bacterium]|nr:hypothetical protein [Bacilli bacterium]